jgi:hypothetical protein
MKRVWWEMGRLLSRVGEVPETKVGTFSIGCSYHPRLMFLSLFIILPETKHVDWTKGNINLD